MNYNKFNDEINLPEELYEKTLNSVKLSVSKHNVAQKRKTTTILSVAACFAVFVCSLTAVNHNGKNNAISDINTSVNSSTENPNNNIIKVITEKTKDVNKIIIGNKIYSQYYFDDEKGNINNNIKIKKSDIGELICTIDYFNLTDDLTNFNAMSLDKAKNNKFYNAKVFRYSKAKSDNVIIVKSKNDYYIFYLDGLTNEYTVKDLLNVYTDNGANKIVEIEIFQDELYDYKIELQEDKDIDATGVRPLLISTIKDEKSIDSILNVLTKNHNSFSSDNENSSEYFKALYQNSDGDNYPLMKDYGVYELKIKFSDGSDLVADKFGLNMFVQKEYFYFELCSKNNTTYYELKNSQYNNIKQIIE